jgi:hypothetical protein
VVVVNTKLDCPKSAVLSIAAVVVCAGSVVMAPTLEASIVQAPEFFFTTCYRGDAGHMVHWRARTSDAGGFFRLYVGVHPGTLQVSALENAGVGEREYSVLAKTPVTNWFYCELRYVTPTGDEVVVASARVNQQRLQKLPFSVDFPNAGEKARIQVRWEPLDPVQRNIPVARVSIPWMPAPEPETPPPRTG